jgi:hypothetical protein
MTKVNRKPETKSWNLSIVIDFMNADFKAEKFGRGVNYLLDAGLSPKKAPTIQQTILAAHGAGNVMPLRDDVERYGFWELEPAADKRFFRMVENISGAEQRLYAALVNVINDRGRFWRLRRCRHCARFFFPRAKQQYCSDVCLGKHNSKTAQERVERARRTRRFKEIFPRLVRLQKLAKTAPFSEILDKLNGFDSKLLAIIVEGNKPLNELASDVKYKNRQILMKAKI